MLPKQLTRIWVHKLRLCLIQLYSKHMKILIKMGGKITWKYNWHMRTKTPTFATIQWMYVKLLISLSYFGLVFIAISIGFNGFKNKNWRSKPLQLMIIEWNWESGKTIGKIFAICPLLVQLCSCAVAYVIVIMIFYFR